MSDKLNILFLCTGNSCRSQMAEGWARRLKGDVINAYSAGIETHGLNPNAVKVMAEAGVDISGHKSENVKDLLDIPFDFVVTVCGHANEHCPIFPGHAKVVHVGFDDPPALARALAAEGASEAEQLDCYRRVRDEIKAFIESLPEGLMEKAKINTMQNKLEIFDPPMCCSSGVCGPDVDPKLVAFSGTLKTIEQQGITVVRHNMAQEPMVFAQNETVRAALQADDKCLPLILLNGKIISKQTYPSGAMLAAIIAENEED